MKETMLGSIFCFAFVLCAVHGSGDFVVLHSPNSVTFSGNEGIEQSLLTEVFAAALGYTVKQRGTWSGMKLTDIFSLPEAVVGIAVEGIRSLDTPYGEKFPLEVNEGEETTWQALSGRVEERGNANNLVRISLGDGLDALGQSALGELKTMPIDKTSLRALSLENEDDRKFVEEIQLLHAIAKKISSTTKVDNKPDVYWLVVSGLRPVFDLHGRNSTAAAEALSLLNDAINVTSEAFVNVYNGKVLIAAFTNDASQVRRTRSVASKRIARDTPDNDKLTTLSKSINAEAKTNSETDRESIDKMTKKDDLNLSKKYSQDYPVIFNILLWFGVIFVFSLLAICIAIADMDPGRDSIIYRMTSNRMKKDN